MHTVNYPSGEINGHFTLANGSQTFSPPPQAPVWLDDSANPNGAVRFLTQATFGAGPSDIAAVQALGYAGWPSNQFSLPVSHHLPVVLANMNPNPTQPFPSSLCFNTWWQQSVTAPDQLRQRVAFALSEIMVVSENGVLANYYANGLASYYDTLLDYAFGNFRSLLKAVTLHPVMGVYLDMRGNDAGSIITGLHANENFAREVMQLFSIGLYRLWPDGTLVLNSQNSLVPTYNQNVINGFASVFTGWNYYQANQANGRLPSNWYPGANYTNPMVLVPTHHALGTKLLLNNVMLPAAQGATADHTNPNFDNYGLSDLNEALDAICNHPNAKLTDDEQRANDVPPWNMRLTARLVIRSSVLFATLFLLLAFTRLSDGLSELIRFGFVMGKPPDVVGFQVQLTFACIPSVLPCGEVPVGLHFP